MRLITSTLFISLFALQANAQWIESSSCDELSGTLVNKGITHLVNLEPMSAVAMANAALIADESCALANIVMADAAIERDKMSHLSKLGSLALSAEEKAYLNIVNSNNEDRPGVALNEFNKQPNNSLLHYKYASSNGDWESMLDGAKKYAGSEQSVAFLNTAAYGYSGGQYGEPDYDRALELLELAINTYDTPNLRDSRAEHYAMLGKMDEAFSEQLDAYASNGSAGSPYLTNLQKYYRATQVEELKDALQELVQERMDATMKDDREGLKALTIQGYEAVACNSNLEPCYVVQPSLDPAVNIEWLEFRASNMDIYFNESFEYAVVSFNASGSYKLENGEVISDYNTRVSEVWGIEDGEWKMWLSNYAPVTNSSGIPKPLSSITY